MRALWLLLLVRTAAGAPASQLSAHVCGGAALQVRTWLALQRWGPTALGPAGLMQAAAPGPLAPPVHRSLLLLDLLCADAAELLRQADAAELFSAPHRWLLLGRGAPTDLRELQALLESPPRIVDGAPATPELEELSLLADSDVTVIRRDDETDSLDIFSAYRRGAGLPLERDVPGREPLAVRRANLRGVSVAVCYVITNNATAQHLRDYKERHVDTITKVSFLLTNHVLDTLNASRTHTFEGSWGYRGPGGWDGLLGELVAGRADVGGSPLFLTADRLAVVDFVAMPARTRSKFVFRAPKLSYLSNVFQLPFRPGVWACCVALVALLPPLMLLAARWEPSPPEESADIVRGSWSDVVLLTFGAVCQQGSSAQLQGPAGRLLMLLLFLSLMFLYTSYSANIVALLQSSSSRIRTLSDLLESRLKLAAHDTIFNRYYFSTASEPVRRAIYRRKIAPPGRPASFLPLEEGVRRMRQGLFAFHMEIGVGYKVVEETFQEYEKCGLQEIQYLQVVDPWIAVRKNSSYKEMYKLGFLRVQQAGLQARETWRLYTHRPRCAARGGFVSVGLVDCAPALRALALGAALALALLLLELLLAHRKKLMLKFCRRGWQSRRSVGGTLSE